MSKRLVIGCGYVGHRVARRWLAAGDEVTVVTRSAPRAAAFRADGFRTLVQDIAETWQVGWLPEVDTLLFAVGFDRRGAHSMQAVYLDGLQNVLSQMSGEPRFLYVSSTGVYGDAAGEWLDESVVCCPVREGGRLCLAAEEELRNSRLAANVVTLRSAGIYGPDRVPNLATLRAGEPLAVHPEGWLNLIHVEDLVTTVCVLAEAATQADCYNVSDGHPVLRRDYYAFLVERYGLPEVTFQDVDSLSPTRRGGANKRISNRRLMDEFQLPFQFPSYREGLVAELG